MDERSERKYRDPLVGRLLAVRLALSDPTVPRTVVWPPLTGPRSRPIQSGLLEGDEERFYRVVAAREMWQDVMKEIGQPLPRRPARVRGHQRVDNARVLAALQRGLERGIRVHHMEREAASAEGFGGLDIVVDRDVLWIDTPSFCLAADAWLRERGWTVTIKRSLWPRWLERWIWPERRNQTTWARIRRIDQNPVHFIDGEWLFGEPESEVGWMGPWTGPVPWSRVGNRMGEAQRVLCPGGDPINGLLEVGS